MRLLVSVRDAAEAREAIAGGADIIDVKEPSRGALGAADAATIAAIAQVVLPHCPLSVALGEVADSTVPPALPDGVQFAKFGLAQLTTVGHWQERWRTAVDQLPKAVGRIAVVYADWRQCAAPRPNEIVELAVEFQCVGVLIDTFDKSLGNLLAHVPLPELTSLCRGIARRQMFVALGGSLTAQELPQIVPLRPQVLAVRTAVCNGDRTGFISASRVAELKQAIHAASRTLSAVLR